MKKFNVGDRVYYYNPSYYTRQESILRYSGTILEVNLEDSFPLVISFDKHGINVYGHKFIYHLASQLAEWEV